jgi:hypothetical protein
MFSVFAVGATCHIPLAGPSVATIDTWNLVHMYAVFTLLVVAPVPWLYRRLPGYRILAYAVAYALGVLIFKESLVAVILHAGVRIPVLHRPGLTTCFLFTEHMLIGGFVGVCLAWLVCRGWVGPVVVQNGSLCPHCAYSLVGCADRICPECGHEFTYESLGTTREQLLNARHPPSESG